MPAQILRGGDLFPSPDTSTSSSSQFRVREERQHLNSLDPHLLKPLPRALRGAESFCVGGGILSREGDSGSAQAPHRPLPVIPAVPVPAKKRRPRNYLPFSISNYSPTVRIVLNSQA